jgi:hypothetical protein
VCSIQRQEPSTFGKLILGGLLDQHICQLVILFEPRRVGHVRELQQNVEFRLYPSTPAPGHLAGIDRHGGDSGNPPHLGISEAVFPFVFS